MPPNGTLGSSGLQALVLLSAPNFLLLVPALLLAGFRTLAPVPVLGSQAQAQVLHRLLFLAPPLAPPEARAAQDLCCTGPPPPEPYQNISAPESVWKTDRGLNATTAEEVLDSPDKFWDNTPPRFNEGIEDGPGVAFGKGSGHRGE